MQYVALTLKQRGERMWFPKGKCSGKEVNDLRKVMLLAAMLAMVLAAAAPALAQTATGGDVAILQYSCDQIQAAVNTQYQQGEGTGAVAGAAESLGIDQQQVLACFGQAAALQDSTVNVNVGGAATATATATAGGGGGAAGAAAGGALPPTGGASLIALGAGALLVAGGLLARRIVR
jgi:hypothetical protein